MAETEAPSYSFERLNYFRFRQLDDTVLVTNDGGYFEFLSEEAFRDFVTGSLPGDHPKSQSLQDKLFYRDRTSAAVDRLREKSGYVFSGPAFHVVRPVSGGQPMAATLGPAWRGCPFCPPRATCSCTP